jgi:hypothetical protein
VRGHDVHDQSLRDVGGAGSRWGDTLVAIDLAFADAAGRAGEALPCRRGCSSCCREAALFEIHAADALVLRDGVSRAPAELRGRIERRAAALLAQVTRAAREDSDALVASWDPREGLATLTPDAFERVASRVEAACPVLEDDGSCGLHAHRPAICRLQGLAWTDPATGAVLPDGCRLDERQQGIPPQRLSLSDLDEAREQARSALAPEQPVRTFVAAAIALR